jgi:predicted dehydrogenase
MADFGRVHRERVRPGEVETFARATGEGERVRIDTEDHASILLRFEDGARGVLTVSQVTAGRKNRLLLEVDAGTASFSWDQEEPNRLWIGRREEANLELVRDPHLLSPGAAALARLPGGHQEGWSDALRNLFAEFYSAVAAGGEGGPWSFASFGEAHTVTRIVEAIAQSDRKDAWVEVEPGPGEVSSS